MSTDSDSAIPLEPDHRARVLVVDDDDTSRMGLVKLLEAEGFAVTAAADGTSGLARLSELAPDILLVDFRMPGLDGLAVLERARELYPDLIAILMTAFADGDVGVRAMQDGAEDYLTKPLHIDELLVIMHRALERRRMRREADQLRARLAEKMRPGNIIGESPAMQSVMRTVERVAPSRATVLITGESGTGKELVAQAIHERSPRARGPFVKLHCAALAESLLESELFGHEKGSFTGAVARREGYFKHADGGTLFLDEIGEISASTQVKLLRFLQERTFERVGGSEPIQVDVRVIAATNRNLADAVKAGRFREDLYYRLNVVNIEIPPLRSRPGDVMALAKFFLERFAREENKNIEGFDASAIELLQSHTWPGNVRELENAIERAVVLCEGKRVSASHLPAGRETASKAGGVAVPGTTLREIEKQVILATLEAAGGSTSRAAQMLGISVRKVQYRLLQYGMTTRRASIVARNGGGSADRHA